jgi:hypothetical protein
VGSVCTYTETWSVPANDRGAIEDYLTIFGRYLFNISNTSLWNITIEPDNPAQFASRAEPLDLQQQRRLQDNEYLEENAYGDVEQIPQSIPWPAPVPVDWREEFDLAKLFPDRLVENPLTPAQSQDLYNIIDCSLEGRDGPDGDEPYTIHPNMLIRLSMKFLTETERGFQACLTMTTQNAMRDLLAPFGMTPCRDRSYICRASLEIIPAPSPPPPDNWVVPPSPPVFGYEVEVVAAAGSGMGLYLIFACICCTAFGGRAMRQRQTSRWWSRLLNRVDGAIPYAAEESRLQGEFYDGLTAGQLPIPGKELVEDTAARASLGDGLARALFAPAARGAPPPAAHTSVDTGGWTFASLVGGGDREQASRTPHNFRC